MTMPIPRKELQLLSTFPRPPPGPPSPARLSLQSPSLTRPSDFGFISIKPDVKSTDDDADSLYDDDPPPLPQLDAFSAPTIAPTPRHSAELQLVLDHPSKVYSPGETITGYIIGCSTPTTHIHIFLSGRSTTTIKDSKIQHIARTPLIFRTTHLRPNSGSWGAIPRFAVTIPHTSETASQNLNDLVPKDGPDGKPYWTTTWPTHERFENAAGHPLPPSTHMPIRSATTLTTHAYGQASISYSLIAVRSGSSPQSATLIPNATHQHALTLTTRRLPSSKIALLASETHALSQDLDVQTAQLAKERRLSLREQLKDAFNASAPIFYFSVSVRTPRLCTPGADIKIAAAMQVRPPPPGKLYNFPIPDIDVVGITVRIRSYTGLRVRGQLSGTNPCTFKHDEVRQVQTPRGASFSPRDGAFEGQVRVSTVALPKGLLPSFKTYNAWRGYRLECVMRVRVAGRRGRGEGQERFGCRCERGGR
ncbi:hypothetical protein N0V90_010918 [Kalmusia sp. IMI 367209]|nr:hypothetical protein N0V90_010918 [Kalmusia sp. IMI 367209]